MNLFCLCITSVLVITSVFSDQKSKINHIRVFPAANQSVAGVFQVSLVNYLNQPQYAFNASEARRFCLSLGVYIASKDQVQRALTKGLETCRFGWIDEHFAVVPRIHATENCGKSQTGLVPWRAPVTKKFDVFCFNESDPTAQLKDATTDTLSSSSYLSTLSPPATQKTHSALFSSRSSSSSTPEIVNREPEPDRYVGGAHHSPGGKLVLITCTSAFLIIAVVILAYLKLHRRCSKSSDERHQHEDIETEEWTCVKNIQESKTSTPQEESTQVDEDKE